LIITFLFELGDIRDIYRTFVKNYAGPNYLFQLLIKPQLFIK